MIGATSASCGTAQCKVATPVLGLRVMMQVWQAAKAWPSVLQGAGGPDVFCLEQRL